MKTTSVLSVIGVAEMFQVGSTISSSTFRVFETYLVVALYYLALTTIWTFCQSGIESILNKRAGLPPAESVLKRLFGVRTRRPVTTSPIPIVQDVS
jgi:polar amino acid transport system permease protein